MKGNARLNKFSENNLEKLKRRFYNFSIIISVIFASFGKRKKLLQNILVKEFRNTFYQHIFPTPPHLRMIRKIILKMDDRLILR